LLGLDSFAQMVTRPMTHLPTGPGGIVLADQLAAASTTPPGAGAEVIGAAVVEEGRVIRCAVNLFDQQMELGTSYERELVAALCDRLLTRRRVRHDAGSSVAVHFHQAEAGYALHLVHWAIERWEKKINPVAQLPPLGAIRVEALVEESVQQVTLEPTGEPLVFSQQGDVSSFVVRSMRVWQLVALHT